MWSEGGGCGVREVGVGLLKEKAKTISKKQDKYLECGFPSCSYIVGSTAH